MSIQLYQIKCFSSFLMLRILLRNPLHPLAIWYLLFVLHFHVSLYFSLSSSSCNIIYFFPEEMALISCKLFPHFLYRVINNIQLITYTWTWFDVCEYSVTTGRILFNTAHTVENENLDVSNGDSAWLLSFYNS